MIGGVEAGSSGDRVLPLLLLGLLHPEGNARRTVVIGAGDAGAGDGDGGGGADLVVVAPTRRQGSSRRWLREAARQAAAAVTGNGVVYVLAGPFVRRRLVHLLRSAGLESVARMIHVPDARTSRRIVPTERHMLAPVVRDAGPAWRSAILTTLVRLPGAASMLAWAAPSVGVVTQRPLAPPPFSWLRQSGHVPLGTITQGWKSSSSSSSAAVLAVFPPSAHQPSVVAKVAASGRGAVALDREAVNLDTVAPSAATAGVTVPSLVSLTELPAARALLQTALGGRVAAVALLAGDVEPEPLLDRIGLWLDAWAAVTRAPAALSAGRVAEHWLEPASLLAPELANGPAYERYLEQSCRSLAGADIPIVATHQDLTMWNVLLEGDRSIGVVDWEAAQPDGLPLVDLIYATVDAHLCARPGSDRASVFRELMAPAGVPAPRGRVDRSAAALGLPPDVVSLCVDACWLSHAANEQRSSSSTDEERPFLAVLELLSTWRTRT